MSTELKPRVTIRQYDSEIRIQTTQKTGHPNWRKEWDRSFYHRVLNLLRSRGWSIERDWTYRSLMQHTGQLGQLKMHAAAFGACAEFVFFQDVVSGGNKSGGRYEFNKLRLMPFLIRPRFTAERNAIFKLAQQIGCVDVTPPVYPLAMDQIKANRESCYHWPDGYIGDREYDHLNRIDADRAIIKEGDVRYFRSWSGVLMRGRCFKNLNNMFYVVTSPTEYECHACFDLFSCKPTAVPRKLHPRGQDILRRKIADASSAMNFELAIRLREQLSPAPQQAKRQAVRA